MGHLSSEIVDIQLETTDKNLTSCSKHIGGLKNSTTIFCSADSVSHVVVHAANRLHLCSFKVYAINARKLGEFVSFQIPIFGWEFSGFVVGFSRLTRLLVLHIAKDSNSRQTTLETSRRFTSTTCLLNLASRMFVGKTVLIIMD